MKKIITGWIIAEKGEKFFTKHMDLRVIYRDKKRVAEMINAMSYHLRYYPLKVKITVEEGK